jgi:hypothetical protein
LEIAFVYAGFMVFLVREGLTGGFWAVLRELFFGGSDISAQSGGGQFEARDSRI